MVFPAACKLTWWGTPAQGSFEWFEGMTALLANEDAYNSDDEADEQDAEVEWWPLTDRFVSFRFADAGCPLYKDMNWKRGPNALCFQDWLVNDFLRVESVYRDLMENVGWYEAWKADCRSQRESNLYPREQPLEPQHPIIDLLYVSGPSLTMLTIDGTYGGVLLFGHVKLLVPAALTILRVAVAELNLKFADIAMSAQNVRSLVLQFKTCTALGRGLFWTTWVRVGSPLARASMMARCAST
jgi:hypothetical protein